MATREEWAYLGQITRELLIEGLMFRSCMGLIVWGTIIGALFALASMLT